MTPRRRSGERLQDQPLRSAAPHRHRPRLPPHRQLLFGLTVRDVDCDFRLMRRSIFERIDLEKTSGVICLEMMKKIQDAGFRIVEVPVHHYHRAFGKSQFFNFRRIFRTGDRRAAAVVRARGDPAQQHRRAGAAPAAAPTAADPSRPSSATSVTAPYREFYRGRRVMITGGLGFIGSNLARQLVELGADVLLVDSLIPDYGGNLFNIDGIDDRVRVNIADVRQQSHDELPGARPRRHLQPRRPGQPHRQHARPVHRSRDQLPQPADAARGVPPPQPAREGGVRRHAAGLRPPDSLPVTEQHLVRPTDVNGINKAAGEYYHLVYNNVFGVRACSLRLTNVYGPRQLIKHNRQGFIGWFIRLAIEDSEIQIYGDGSQLRDFVYVDDAADAFLRAGAERRVQRRGVQRRRRRADHATAISSTLLIDVAGTGPRRVRRVAAGEEGDRHRRLLRRLVASSRATTGWTPTVAAARRACARTLAFYRAAPRPLRRPTPAHAEPRVTRPRDPLRSTCVPARTPPRSAPRSSASSRSGWFVLGPEVEAFEARVRRRRAARRTRSASATAPMRSR